MRIIESQFDHGGREGEIDRDVNKRIIHTPAFNTAA